MAQLVRTSAILAAVLAGAGVATGSEDVRKLAVSAHHEAQQAASQLGRIDANLARVPDEGRREQMKRQRRLLEQQLERELESVRRIANRIAALERQVGMEAMHGATLPGEVIEAHPAGPEPAVPDVPMGVPPVPGEPEEGAGEGPPVVIPAD